MYSYLWDTTLELVREFVGLSDAQPVSPSTAKSAPSEDNSGPASTLDMSMLSVATKLNAKSGPDLAVAAAAFLTICKGEDVVSRKDILDTMKAAPAYYKRTMSGNLSGSLQRLLKQERLNQTGEGQYALAIKEKERLHAILTDGS